MSHPFRAAGFQTAHAGDLCYPILNFRGRSDPDVSLVLKESVEIGRAADIRHVPPSPHRILAHKNDSFSFALKLFADVLRAGGDETFELMHWPVRIEGASIPWPGMRLS